MSPRRHRREKRRPRRVLAWDERRAAYPQERRRASRRFRQAGTTRRRLKEKLTQCPLSWPIDHRHVTRYIWRMIKSFADKHTEQLWVTGKSRRLSPDIARRALHKLSAINATEQVDGLRVPPGNRLHALGSDRAGQYSISINDQWRICFRFQDGDAYDIEICDYH